MSQLLKNSGVQAQARVWRPAGLKGDILVARIFGPGNTPEHLVAEARRCSYLVDSARAMVVFPERELDASNLLAQLSFPHCLPICVGADYELGMSVEDTTCAGLLIDVRGIDYTWGDDLSLEPSLPSARGLPVAVLAGSEQEQAVRPMVCNLFLQARDAEEFLNSGQGHLG